MGLDRHSAQFLASAKLHGVSFGRVLTIGRQNLDLTATEYAQIRQRLGLPPASSPGGSRQQFAERFFVETLGATSVDSMDVSDFEGASVVHDMNTPVPERFHNTYTVIVDGGSIEHIFDFPNAIANEMLMLKEGGRLFVVTPANNHLGHGFYQFSPELFFRVLSEHNGFRVERLVVYQVFGDSRWYEVADPELVRERVELVNNYPVNLMVQAIKTKNAELFRPVPQQSDYSRKWTAFREGTNVVPPLHNVEQSRIRAVFGHVMEAVAPSLWRQFAFQVYKRKRFLSHNRKHFKQVEH